LKIDGNIDELGAVVDVHFDGDKLPLILDALEVVGMFSSIHIN